MKHEERGAPRPASPHFAQQPPPTRRITLQVIITERLELLRAAPDSVSAARNDIPKLGRLLGASVPASWPPDLLDRDALEWTLRAMADPAFDPRWGMFWILLREPRTLVGVAGFKGHPRDGAVELGYGIVSDRQRRGYATEATRALVRHAFTSLGVTRVLAETLPGHLASIGVLDKCGFTFIGNGSEPGVMRYELVRHRER